MRGDDQYRQRAPYEPPPQAQSAEERAWMRGGPNYQRAPWVPPPQPQDATERQFMRGGFNYYQQTPMMPPPLPQNALERQWYRQGAYPPPRSPILPPPPPRNAIDRYQMKGSLRRSPSLPPPPPRMRSIATASAGRAATLSSSLPASQERHRSLRREGLRAAADARSDGRGAAAVQGGQGV